MTSDGATPRRRVERAMRLGGGTPLAQFSDGRSCAHPGCTSRLSRYNPNPTCAAHGGWTQDKGIRRRVRRLPS